MSSRRSSFAAAALLAGSVVCLTACSNAPDSAPPPMLAKLAEKIPEPPPPPPPPAKPAPPKNLSVSDVLRKGCTTTVVKGLSQQIIAEGNCIEPGAYERVPKRANLNLGKAVFPYMKAPARNALVKALDKVPKRRMKVNSMLRTVAQQYLLFDWYKRKRCGIKLAAEPGTSNHQGGLAIDISNPQNWRKTLERHGFRWLGKRDRWHFDYVKGEDDGPEGLDIRAFQQLWNLNNPDDTIDVSGDWDDDTEQALRDAPANGFPIGASCGEDLSDE